jgi:outer membrane protein assembly factor BamE (lipoprotein component of BamABCDE complex)
MREWSTAWLCAALLAGCASYDGRGLVPGQASADDVRRTMGAPAEIYQEGDGQLWAYPRGPAGPQTFMARIGADGKLISIQPAFTWENFARLREGITQQEVRRILGPPVVESRFSRRSELIWDYFFKELSTDAGSYFHVVFGPDGRMKGTLITRIHVGPGDARH